MPIMNRREALQATSALLGGAMLASGIGLGACSGDGRATARAVTDDDVRLMEEIADTILPTTPASPGAKAAGVGAAISLLLTDCRDEAAQRRMLDGLATLRAVCAERCSGDFTRLSPAEREALLTEIDAEAVRAGDDHWFHLMRDLSLQAYFSSEIGMTRALRYIRVPGRWTGCLPLEPGQPAWG